MYREVVLLFLIGHFLGDYYLQTNTLAKKQSTSAIMMHCFIYLVTMLIVILPIINGPLLIAALSIGIIHLVIDYSKYLFKKHKNFTSMQNIFVYLFDQLLHIGFILVTGIVLVMNQININFLSILQPFILELQLNTDLILSWVLIILIVCKPASVTIRIVLDNFEPKHKQRNNIGLPNAGALIGIFERLIILFMLYANQFAAIGFVLTAKSVARYNKISENPPFAEYYLLGTLLSSLLIIISFYLVF